MAAKEPDRILAAVGHQHAVAGASQHLETCAGHGRVVLNDQNRLAAVRPGRLGYGGHLSASVHHLGEHDLDGSSPAGLGMQRDPATGLGHESLDHCQSKSRARTDRLRGEEGVEDLRVEFERDTGTRVCDRDRNPGCLPGVGRRPSAPALGGNSQAPTAGHSVARVGGEVEQHPFQAAAIRAHRGCRRIRLDHHGHVLAHQACQHRPNRSDHLVHVDDLGLQHRPAGIG